MLLIRTCLRATHATLVAATVWLASPQAPALAEGELLVMPSRLVFEGSERSSALSLTNTGRETATYRISFVQRRMNETGDFTEIQAAGPGERFADALIRYSPSQVTLPPGGTQTIRMQLRKPANLEAGEYRSHLMLRAVPTSDAGDAPASGASGAFAIRLTAIYGMTIPVIVRHGETAAAVAIEDVKLERDKAHAPQAVMLRVRRDGNRSVYGSVVATFVPESGRPVVVGHARGVAVYTPNTARRMRLPLQLPAGLTLKGGKLRVTYEDPERPAQEALAEASLPLP